VCKSNPGLVASRVAPLCSSPPFAATRTTALTACSLCISLSRALSYYSYSLRDRSAIYGQQIHEKVYQQDEVPKYSFGRSTGTQGFAHSALKGSPAGLAGSYEASLAYLEAARKRRDDLMAKVEK
jgi:hypothetical protein